MHIKTSEQQKVKLGFGNYRCNWGLHLAGLYETEEERDDIIYSFLNQGLKEGSLVVFSSNHLSAKQLKNQFSKIYPQSGYKLENEVRFIFLSSKELYYPDGEFSPWKMDDRLNKIEKTAKKYGRTVRILGNMRWIMEKKPENDHIMAYESRVNNFMAGKRWLALCMYDITLFSGEFLMNVLRTHPCTINGKIITQNPYYMNPDDYLKKHAPQFLKDNRAP
ncbi:MAG TPA: MEDS domain-containing protein [bacterium]|nr:MEDS domain-containing protein [bacterium]